MIKSLLPLQINLLKEVVQSTLILNLNIKISNKLKNVISPLLKNVKKKVHAAFKENIWDADLADMQLLSRYNKGIRFLLCVIVIFSKYAWVVSLKDKKGISIVKAFQSILKQSSRRAKGTSAKHVKPNKIWVEKGSEFYNASF